MNPIFDILKSPLNALIQQLMEQQQISPEQAARQLAEVFTRTDISIIPMQSPNDMVLTLNETLASITSAIEVAQPRAKILYDIDSEHQTDDTARQIKTILEDIELMQSALLYLRNHKILTQKYLNDANTNPTNS